MYFENLKKYRPFIWTVIISIVFCFLLWGGLSYWFLKTTAPNEFTFFNFGDKTSEQHLLKNYFNKITEAVKFKSLGDNKVAFHPPFSSTMAVLDLKTQKMLPLNYLRDVFFDSVEIFGNTIFVVGHKVNGGEGKIFALDKDTGRELWSKKIPALRDYTYSKILINNGELYLLSGEVCARVGFENMSDEEWENLIKEDLTAGNVLYKIDPSNGKIIWSFEYLGPNIDWLEKGEWNPFPAFNFENNYLKFTAWTDCTGEVINQNYKINLATGKDEL